MTALEIVCVGGPCDGQQVRNPDKFLPLWDAAEGTRGSVVIGKQWHGEWHQYRMTARDRAVWIGREATA